MANNESAETALPVTTERSPADPNALGWRRAQAASGLVLAAFVGLHLVNLPFALVPGGYDAYQRVLRVLYQSPFFEIPFVMLPLAVHMSTGVRALVRSKGRAAARTLPARLHRWSGWYLLAVVVGHIIAVRGPSVVYDIYPESIGLDFALEWIPIFFWPYYVGLALAGVAHLGYGVPRALSVLRRRPDRSATSRPLALTLGVAAILVSAGLLGLGGVFYAIEDPFLSDYAAMYRDMGELPLVPAVPESR